MKKITQLIILPSIFFFVSCKGFLDEAPKSQITNQYSMTEDGVERLVLSLYETLRDLTDPLFFMGEGGVDLLTHATNGQNYTNAAGYIDGLMASSTFNLSLWKSLYNSLNVSNMAIEYTQLAELPDQKRAVLSAEAKAMRAFFMWLIVETYGPAAHFSTQTTKGVITEAYQPGLAKFYQQIISDIDAAIEGLGPASSYGRMNAGTAKAIKVRALMSLAAYDAAVVSEVGFTKEQCYQQTAALTSSIINDYNYNLLEDYGSVFKTNNQINDEVIWSIQYTSDWQFNNGGGNHMHRYLIGWYNRSARNLTTIPGLPSHSVVYGREYRWAMPTLSYIRMFSPYDKRRAHTFQTVWCRINAASDPEGKSPITSDTLLIRSLDPVTEAQITAHAQRGIVLDGLNHIYDLNTGIPTVNGRSGHHSITKHLDESREIARQENAFKDAVLIRLAEMYISQAEAYVRLGRLQDAAQTITALRKRAITAGHEKEMQVAASDMSIDFILDEHARELGAEFFRWYMLKRSGILVERLRTLNPDAGSRVQPHHINRPVPQAEIDIISNKGSLKQNEGY